MVWRIIRFKQKSELILVDSISNVDDLVIEMGYRKGMLPIMYLGLSLGVSYKLTMCLNLMEDRVYKRLAR